MTDTEKKVAEIREALEKATPGPWTKFENRIYGKAQPAVEPIICEFYEEETERDRNNAHLIANAHEWLRFLLDELERLEREYAEERAAHNAHVAELCELEQELDIYKASSEVFYERLKKACEDREKLIDALQTIRTDTECPYTSAFAKRKLKEIGVVVE